MFYPLYNMPRREKYAWLFYVSARDLYATRAIPNVHAPFRP